MNSDDDPELFAEALRLDLPDAADEARVRGRLVSAGILAGLGVVTPGAAVAATATSAGFAAKLLALPLALKVGASVALAGLIAVPVTRTLTSSEPSGRQVVAARVAPATPPRPPIEPAAVAATPLAPMPAAAPEAPAEPTVARHAAPALTRTVAPRAELRVATETTPSLTAAAVGAFPVSSVETVDEGTLREETALMERALAALKRGDLATARRELGVHAERFPQGHLAPERQRAFDRMLGKENQR